MTAEAFRAYDRAQRQFAHQIFTARAARKRHETEAAGRRDALFPECVRHLTDIFAHEWHHHDEAAMRTRGDDWADRAEAGWEEYPDQFRQWRTDGDLAALGH